MNISKSITKICVTFFAVLVVLFAAAAANAQTDSTPKKRLKSPATVKGTVGGESHDSYVIRVRRGQRLRVQISWKGKGDKTAAFVVSKSGDFFAGDVVEGGRETYDGKNWSAKISATGDYYIYVTGHPAVDYALKVSLG